MGDFESIEQRIRGLRDKKRMGDAFEHAVAHYLRHDPAVAFTEVWLWSEWLERIDLGLKADQGIDIVAKDAEGTLVAVQVKFHGDPRRDVTQREIATLFSLRPDLFRRQWVVSNAIGHSQQAERATSGGGVTWVHRDRLLASLIDWTGALDAASGTAQPGRSLVEPREPDQVAAITDTVEALRDQERVQLIMACGTGKTLVTRWITEARDDRLVLVLVPTLLLLKQFRTEWQEQARHGFIDLGVCSDADTMGRDEMVVHTDELEVRVTTDPADIATFLRGQGRRVIFGTYASSARIAEAQARPGVPAFDLVVADEAHRVAGITTKTNQGDRDLRVVLDDQRIRASRRLFATATPRVYALSTRARLGDREDIEIASMDDPLHFGLEAHRLWFRRAVELGRLVDYRLSVVVVTDAEVAKLVRERAILDVQGRTFDAETLASIVALRRAIPELGIQRAISFHHTIARARDFARELVRLDLDAPPVTARHISGAMSMADRGRVLATLRDPVRPTVVTNARCLTEGIDVPNLDAVAFVDPRSAPVDIVQAVGRVMRIAPGKEMGHVIVPVFLREEDLSDPEVAVESSAFAPVLDVLRALRAHDPELVTDATRIATSLGLRDATVGGHIDVHVQFLGRQVDIRRFEQALKTRFVDVSADGFEVGFAHLRAYVEREGHARVPARHVTDDGYALGTWAWLRRREHDKGRLAAGRVAALGALPGWTWNPLEDDWQEGLTHLHAYIALEGHARVPTKHVAPDGYRLGLWALHQRGDLRVGRLTDDRVAALSALPGWTWDPNEDDWQEGLAQLCAYVEREGHARVPLGNMTGVGYRLGSWVAKRREDRRVGRLTDDRVAALEALPGWSWEPMEDDWQEGLAYLRAFVALEGHARVPMKHVSADGHRLGRWLSHQREGFRVGRLTDDRVAALSALPGWTWDPNEDDWQEGLAQLCAYVEREGHARVPDAHVTDDGFRLGTWVANRRHARGRLTDDRVAALEALPGWSWEPMEDDWQEGLAYLRAFVALEGHARVPQKHVTDDGYRLGMWVSNRRRDHVVGRLTDDRVAALGALPGWTWEAT